MGIVTHFSVQLSKVSVPKMLYHIYILSWTRIFDMSHEVVLLIKYI